MVTRNGTRSGWKTTAKSAAKKASRARTTDASYSQMGLVLFRRGKPYVFEAGTPVRQRPLEFR